MNANLVLSDAAVGSLTVADAHAQGPNVSLYFDYYFDIYLALASGATLALADAGVATLDLTDTLV